MARVLYGSIITSMAGSIAGTTFQDNKAAKIARLRPTRRKQNTLKQGSQIVAFQGELPGWAALSQATKDDWNTFATAHDKVNKWGVTKTLSGFNWFMSCNNYLTLVGETPLSSPPVYETPLVVPDYGAQAIPTDFLLDWTPNFDHSSAYLLLFTSPLLRSISLANRKVLRLTSIIDPATTDTYDWESEWEAAHGISTPIAGDPEGKSILCAVLSIHETKGLASAFTLAYATYEPS